MKKNAATLIADLTECTAVTNVHGGASAVMMVNKYMKLPTKLLLEGQK